MAATNARAWHFNGPQDHCRDENVRLRKCSSDEHKFRNIGAASGGVITTACRNAV